MESTLEEYKTYNPAIESVLILNTAKHLPQLNHLLHFMRCVKHFLNRINLNVSRETLHKHQHHLFTSGGSTYASVLAVTYHLLKGYCAMAKDALRSTQTLSSIFPATLEAAMPKFQQDDISRFLLQAKANDIHPFLAHAPYTLNGCSADPALRDFAKRTMADDLARLESTPGNLYNFHPGSHVVQGTDVGISYIADMLNEILN